MPIEALIQSKLRLGTERVRRAFVVPRGDRPHMIGPLDQLVDDRFHKH
jgi:hypothetical protein